MPTAQRSDGFILHSGSGSGSGSNAAGQYNRRSARSRDQNRKYTFLKEHRKLRADVCLLLFKCLVLVTVYNTENCYIMIYFNLFHTSSNATTDSKHTTQPAPHTHAHTQQSKNEDSVAVRSISKYSY